MSRTAYDQDLALWAREQAHSLRAGDFASLDLSHLAEEIEDLGKSEKRELANRLAALIAHLLKWRFQPAMRSRRWEATIRTQRIDLGGLLKDSPSLRTLAADTDWTARVWEKARILAIAETGLDALPSDLPWTIAEALDADFWPDG